MFGERQQAVRAMRGQMWSPGRPSAARREDRLRFWEAIARGASSEDAAAAAGVSPAVGVEMVPRGWRDAANLVGSAVGALSVVRRAGGDRDPSRSARRGARDRSPAGSFAVDDLAGAAPQRVDAQRTRLEYRATTAQWHAERRASRPKVAKLAANDALREYVQDRLAGTIARPDGEPVPGPQVRLDRSSPRSPSGPALGEVVESGADREPAPGRLPR